MKQINTLRG